MARIYLDKPEKHGRDTLSEMCFTGIVAILYTWRNTLALSVITPRWLLWLRHERVTLYCWWQ